MYLNRLLCPRSGDCYNLDFSDNSKNNPCILEKHMVKVRGHDNRIPVAIFPFIEENDNSSDINRNQLYNELYLILGDSANAVPH